MSNESPKILTEGGWQKRCRQLVFENDELMTENMFRKKYEGFLKSVIRSGERLEDECDFEWFKKQIGSFSKVSEVFK